MALLLIRVDHPPGGTHLAVRGLMVDQSDGSWSEIPCAERLLPRDEPVLQQARDALLSSAGPATAPDVGRRLWQLVTEGPVGTWWEAEVAGAAEPVVRTVLDVRAPELRSVPWELMAGVRGAPPFRSDDRPWVRAHTPWQPLAELAVPVRVLVVVGDPDDEDLEVEAQLAAIHGALRQVPGRWHVETLLAPSISELRTELREVEPDVLHVIAHGTSRGNEHVLRMMDGTGGGQWPLEQRDVRELPLPVPRLVILDACRSAGPALGRDSSLTFADEFLDRGSAAVISMQGDIKSVAAVEFSRTLYQQLAAGGAVDIAAARARRAVSDVLRKDNDDRCWALPCLSVAADPDRVLPVRVAQRDEQRLAVPPYSVRFGPIGQCVDRSSERRWLWHALDPEIGPGSPGLLLVTGAKGVGKSAVVLSALLTLRLRGRNVVYVDLAELADREDTRVSWLAVLRAVRNAIWDWVPELPCEPKARFDHELAYLIRHQDPVPWSADHQLADPATEFPSEGDKYAEWIERIFRSFRRMLDAAAETEPLLVVLDAVGVVEDVDLRTWLSRLLLEPAGRKREPRVHLVVVGTGSDVDRLSSDARGAGRVMSVNPFRAAELPRLAREFYARLDVPLADNWWPQVRGLVGNAPGSWNAVELASVLGLYKLYSVGR